jgi:hypothetical protein
MNQDLIQGASDVAAPGRDHPGSEARVWAARIAECWRSSVEGIIRTGRLLIEAKADLPHGEFGSMIEANLPFGERVAQMLMVIGADARLSNPKFLAVLPPSYGTLYDLTRLSDDELEEAVQLEKITPDTKRREVAEIRPRIAQPMSDAEIDAGEPPGLTGTQNHAEADPVREAGLGGGSPASMPSGGLAIAHRRVEDADSLDFFPTPLWATRALVEHVFGHLERRQHCQFQTAWEPACGEGHMAEPLREYFRHVVATDIKDYGYGDYQLNFLDSGLTNNADWIITNPPFNDSADFVLKALKLAGTGVAMFVRLAWLESVGRYEKIFRDHPPTLISFFAERVPLHKGRWEEDGTTMTAYIWLVWIKGSEPRAPFWIPPGCRESLTKADDGKRFSKPDAEQAA